MNDLTERPWFVFRLPAATAYVPAATEQTARSALAATCYPNAPVDTWPLVETRVTSRQALAASLLRGGRA